MNTFHKNFLKAAFASLLVCAPTFADGDRGGSMGTQGGANIPAWSRLAPQVVETYFVQEIAEPRTTQQINNCHVSRPSGADEDNGFSVRRDHSFPLIGRRRYTHFEEVTRYNLGDHLFSREQNLLRQGVRRSLGEGHYFHCPPNRATAPLRQVLSLDGEEVTFLEILEKLDSVGDFAVSQVRANDPTTWRDGIAFDRWVGRVLRDFRELPAFAWPWENETPERQMQLQSQFMDPLQQRATRTILRSLQGDLERRVQEINEMIRRTVNSEGQCNHERYAELKARVRSESTDPTSPLNPQFATLVLSQVGEVSAEEAEHLRLIIDPIRAAGAEAQTRIGATMGITVLQACDLNDAVTDREMRFEPRRRRSARRDRQ